MAGTAEVSTTNLRAGASFDNLKASWGKALNIGGVNTQLDCTYDRNACKDYLNTASVRPCPTLHPPSCAPFFCWPGC